MKFPEFIPKLPAKSKYGAVIIETRPFYKIVDVIKNHLWFLGSGWGLTVLHSNANKAYFESILAGWKNVHMINMGDCNNMSLDDYNKLLAAPEFWQAIPYEKVLIFQHDSLLLRKGIEEFLSYDYVGAAWQFQQHGGNGGLSLRTVKTMLQIINNNPYSVAQGNEDVYFCNHMHKHNMNMAPREVCEKFSVESVFNPNPFGIHAIEKWLPPHQVVELKSKLRYK